VAVNTPLLKRYVFVSLSRSSEIRWASKDSAEFSKKWDTSTDASVMSSRLHDLTKRADGLDNRVKSLESEMQIFTGSVKELVGNAKAFESTLQARVQTLNVLLPQSRQRVLEH